MYNQKLKFKNSTYNSIKNILKNKPNKKVKELYNENYKTWVREIKENLNTRRSILCSWIGRLKIVKNSIPPTKLICRLNAVSKFKQPFL